MCFFNRGNIEGTNSSTVSDVCVCMFYVCRVIIDIYVRRVWKCVFAYEFDCPEVTLCG